MEDNRRRVLEMLAQGKITTEEADRLLGAIGQALPTTTRAHAETGVTTPAAVMDQPAEGRDDEEPEERDQSRRRDEGRKGSRDQDDRFAVGTSPHLEVRNLNGRISLKAGGGNEIRVIARLKNTSRLDYRAVQDGDTVSVHIDKTEGFSLFGRSPGADLEITAPARTTVDLVTSNGRIDVKEIHGSGPIHTSNGRIVLEKVKGDHEVATSNGSIRVDGMEGGGDFKSTNGSIGLNRVAGKISAFTSNGSIAFDGELPNDATSRFETSNGSVAVKLRGQPSVKIDAQTSHGQVKCELPVTSTATAGRSHFTGTIGNGDAELSIRTSNGSVNIS